MKNQVLIDGVGYEELESKLRGIIRDEIATLVSKKDNFLTRHEAAAKLRISTVTLDKRIREGRLPSYRINGRILLRENEISESIKV